jgi:hypothetical protein
MGQRLKLDTEKAFKDASVYEVQMSRRIWWQVLLMDSRCAQLCGMQPSVPTDMVNFPLPANLNDAEINPGMKEMPVEHKGPTEMLFCLLRYDFGRFLQSSGKLLQGPSTSFAEKDALIAELENHLESHYLRYYDPALPIHLLAVGGARCAIAKLRLMAHHPTQYAKKGVTMTKTVRDMLFSTSMKMIEYDILGKSMPLLDSFAWHMDAYFQLDAFVFMLIESRSQAPSPVLDKAWNLVAETYKYRPALLDTTNSELFAAVAELTLRSWHVRQNNLERAGLPTAVEPWIIEKLRAHKTEYTTGRHESGALPAQSGGGDSNQLPNHVPSVGSANLFAITRGESPVDEENRMNTENYENAGLDDDAFGEWDTIDWSFWQGLQTISQQPPHGQGSII